MVDYPNCRLTTWVDVDRWADAIAAKVRASGHLPTTIVGLTRGGWVPSRLLADRLGVKRVVSLRMSHWGVTATPSGKAEMTEGLSGPVNGEDVLVVDDITDTGESLRIAVEHVRAQGAKRVESATCLHIEKSEFVPTYHADSIARDQWVWIVFPWNYWEDLGTLARRAWDETKTPEGVRRLLAERCGLDVPMDDIARALGPAPISG